MTRIAPAPDTVFDAFARMFENCPKAVSKVREDLGDAGRMTDFWFDFVLGGKHAVFYKIRIDGRTDLRFVLLEQE